MKKKFIICLICLFAVPVVAQVGSNIALEPVMGIIIFDDNLADQQAVSFGLTLIVSLTSQLNTGLSYKTSSATQNIQIPGSTLQLNTDWQLYQMHLTYNLINLGDHFYISPSIGLGGIRLTMPSMKADLGALGETTIPARSSTHFIYSPALQFRLQVINRISVIMSPGLHLFRTSENHHTNYFIEGGLQIAIR